MSAPSHSPDRAEARSRAGRIAAAARWGPEPRSIRLDALASPIRAAVLALIAADQAVKNGKATDVFETSSVAKVEVSDGALDLAS